MAISDIITSSVLTVVTMGVGRIWYLTNQRDSRLLQTISELNKVMAKNQERIEENSKNIAVTLQKIESLEKRSIDKMEFLEKLFNQEFKHRR